MVSFGPEEPDFCLAHGATYMRREMGNPIAICEACEMGQLVWEQAEAKLANFMKANSFATGHGANFDALLRELEWQVKELRQRPDPDFREVD